MGERVSGLRVTGYYDSVFYFYMSLNKLQDYYEETFITYGEPILPSSYYVIPTEYRGQSPIGDEKVQLILDRDHKKVAIHLENFGYSPTYLSRQSQVLNRNVAGAGAGWHFRTFSGKECFVSINWGVSWSIKIFDPKTRQTQIIEFTWDGHKSTATFTQLPLINFDTDEQ
jgi:hypothetical protein